MQWPVTWICLPALNIPCPGVRADGRKPFPALLGPRDPGPPSTLFTLPGSSFYRAPPRLFANPTLEWGTG